MRKLIFENYVKKDHPYVEKLYKYYVAHVIYLNMFIN